MPANRPSSKPVRVTRFRYTARNDLVGIDIAAAQ